MRAHVTASRPVEADPWPVIEQYLHEASGWAPPPARPLENGGLLCLVHLGPLRHHIALHVGEPWTLPDAVSRPISWQPCDERGRPLHDRVLPGFDGRMTLRHQGHDVEVVVEGTYVPPGGTIGATADRLLLHRSGEATIRALIADVVDRLAHAVPSDHLPN